MATSAIDPQRIRLLRDTVREMSTLEAEEVHLLFLEAGVDSFDPDDWYGNQNWSPTDAERRGMVMQRIQRFETSALRQLATAIRQVFTNSPEPDGDAEPRSLELFASHLSPHQKHVHQVHETLARYGIHLFVAHEHVEPDAEWAAEISAALSRAAGGVVFMHPSYDESLWCDQEAGWLLGRGVPIRTLVYQGKTPYGLLGVRQGFDVPNGMTASAIAETLVQWAQSQPQLSGAFVSSIADALGKSMSFDFSGRLWSLLEGVTSMTGGQVATVASALRDNTQLWCEYRVPGPNHGASLPRLILPALERQPGYGENAELIKEVAAMSPGLRDVLRHV